VVLADVRHLSGDSQAQVTRLVAQPLKPLYEQPVAQDGRLGEAQNRDCLEGVSKKVVRPSRRLKMAEHALNTRSVSIRLACQAFRVSQACVYRMLQQNGSLRMAPQPRNGCGFTITNAHIGHWAD